MSKKLSEKVNYQIKSYKAKLTSEMYGIDTSKIKYSLKSDIPYLTALWNLFELCQEVSVDYYSFDEGQAKLSEILSIIAQLNEEGFDPNDLKIISSGLFYAFGYPAAAKLVLDDLSKEPERDFDKAICGLSRKEFNVVFKRDSLNQIFKLLIKLTDYNSNESNLELNNLVSSEVQSTLQNGSSDQILKSSLFEQMLKRFLAVNLQQVLSDSSNIGLDGWKEFIEVQAQKGVTEFWPSQLSAIKKGLLSKGSSFAFKMPTSSGKTQSIQLILYNFFKTRKGLVTIIVPYRALLREIEKDIKGILNLFNIKINVIDDLKLSKFIFNSNDNSLLITTPEKLNYLLREDQSLYDLIKLYIVDEGHLFDSERRGISYELLFTNILMKKSENSNVVFISAVMPNVDEVIDWIGVDSENAVTSDYKPTITHIGVCQEDKGSYILKFISDEGGFAKDEHYVPFFITPKEYQIKKSTKVFPDSTSSSSVASAVGLKSLNLGAVAIYTGQPAWVNSIAKQVIEGLRVELNSEYQIELNENVQEIYDYSLRYLGPHHMLTLSLSKGFGVHHGQLLQSFKELIEFSVKEEVLPLVVCTSTLAEGVNLPIKTLVIHSAKNGESDLSNRDFLNLAGRSGRASREVSGNVIFVETKRNRAAISKYVGELTIENCYSMILGVANYIYQNDLKIADIYDTDEFRHIFDSFEMFLFSFVDDQSSAEDIARKLAERTLAYKQAIKLNRAELIEKLVEIISYTLQKIKQYDSGDIKVYSRTGESLKKCEVLKEFIESNKDYIDNLTLEDSSLEKIIGVLFLLAENEFNKDSINNMILDEFTTLLLGWINCSSPYEINLMIEKHITERRKQGVKKHNEKVKKLKEANQEAPSRKKTSSWDIDKTTSFIMRTICYSISNTVGSLSIMYRELYSDQEIGFLNLVHLQKRLKYGLKTENEVSFQALGVSDRSLCVELSALFEQSQSKNKYTWLKSNIDTISEDLISNYPSFFESKIRAIIA